jgi:nucleotide-binding universal stress UspA family protein
LFDLNELHKVMDGYIAAHVAEAMPNGNRKVNIRPIIAKGRTEDEITGLAEREQVDLIVMGSAKGVVTNRVIRNTNRPVLAVSSKQLKTDDAKVRKISRILVATDFSEHSKRVMRYAFDLKRTFDASIYLLYVIETSRAIEFAIRQGHYVDTIEKMRDWATNQLVNLTPDEFIDDPTVFRLVESGTAGETISDVAFEVGADLTILATHEYGTVHKRLMKTTTDKVLTKTSTPVLAVKI